MDTIPIGWDGLTIEQVHAVARKGAAVQLTPAAEERIVAARKLVEQWVAQEVTVYGVTTGFGALSDVAISKSQTRDLQRNIILSHAAGVGRPIGEEEARAILLLRIKDLARGHSGIRLETVQYLLRLLNDGVTPLMPAKGSVGASGDLAPLAHLALILLGEGEAYYRGRIITGAEALKNVGLDPLQLEAAEGLALVNGTQVMTGIGALNIYDAEALSKVADIAAALSLEVLMGSKTEFDPLIHRVRPHPGQAAAADNMDRITANSEIISSHKDCKRVQDAYTLRCSPQVHGASKDLLNFARKVIETEMNASTNNPLIFPETKQFLLGGNFHGQPVALAMDSLCLALAELANISERRIERLVNPKLSGLPAFLVSDGGLNSGLMIAQYTAAALVSENKVLSHPASVDSIPTSANKEDHVSMGTISARKCSEVAENSRFVVAIEMLCAAQALDLFTNLKPGDGTLAAYKTIRTAVSHMEKDRLVAKDIGKVVDLLKGDRILDAVEAKVGPLKGGRIGS
jgi:histidine ammonia-lyase